MADDNATTQEIEILENSTALLGGEDNEILTRLKCADDVAQEMEQKLDEVLSHLDRLLAELDSGDVKDPIVVLRDNPGNESATGKN